MWVEYTSKASLGLSEINVKGPMGVYEIYVTDQWVYVEFMSKHHGAVPN